MQSTNAGQLSNKREEVQSIKEEKQKWRQKIDHDRRKAMKAAIRKKEAVQRHEEELRKAKAKKQAEKEKANRERAEKKVRDEEKIAKKKQLEVEFLHHY